MSLLLWISSLLWLETFKRAIIKTKTHTLIKRIWAVIRFNHTSVICLWSKHLCSQIKPIQCINKKIQSCGSEPVWSVTMYHRRSIRPRAVTTVCAGYATVNTPNRRDLQICAQTHANTHQRSAIGPAGIAGCPPGLNPPGHECFPWTESCPGRRD